MNRFIMAGASHMRYKFDYIVQACYNPGGNFLRSKRFKNMIFIGFEFAEEVSQMLLSAIGNMTFTETDMLFVQTGAWNLESRGLGRMMDSSLKIYADALVAVRAKIDIPRSNFVVVTQTPFAMHESNMYSSGDRNNYCIAACVRRLKSLLRPPAVNIYDEFAILRPQSENTICGVHLTDVTTVSMAM